MPITDVVYWLVYTMGRWFQFFYLVVTDVPLIVNIWGLCMERLKLWAANMVPYSFYLFFADT